MVNFGFPANVLFFPQPLIPQAQIMAAANGIPSFALPVILGGYDQVVGQNPLAANAFVPPALQMPSPAVMMPVMAPIAGAGYAQPQGVTPYSQGAWLQRLFDPASREAARMEWAMRSDPYARGAFEHSLGGRIMDYGSAGDGRFTLQRGLAQPQMHAMSLGALSPIASQLGGVYQQMGQGVAGVSPFTGAGGFAQSPFMPLALNGFANMASQLVGGQPHAMMGMEQQALLGAQQQALMGLQQQQALMGLQQQQQALLGAQQLGMMGGGGFDGFGGGVQGMPLFGQGQASWNPLAAPGKIQGGNAAVERAHSAQVGSLLADPSLTMEDKIMLTLMLICQKMDDDIKRQSNYLNQLQNQQGGRGKKGGKMGGDGEKSIDLETKKLERMIQKRSQLFDTLGKIMERYDQSAKNVIQSMRG